MAAPQTNPPRGEHRIVFRHRDRTVDVFDTDDGSWHYMVEGDRRPSHGHETAGRAIEGGIKVAEAKSRRENASKRKPSAGATPNPKRTVAAYLRNLT